MRTFVLGLLSLAACTSDSESTASSQLTGTASYRDAATAHDGSAQQPAAPPAQDAQVSVLVKGTGQIPQVDPHCVTDPAGAFEAHYASTLAMADGSAYAAGIASGTLTTPSGCAISSLSAGVVTDIVVT